MVGYAGDLEKVDLYSFPVANTALRRCQSADSEVCGGAGETSSNPSMLDLARARMRDPVMIPGPLMKRAKLAPLCKHDESWEESTQILTKTLEAASWVVIEENEGWKVVESSTT